jgi:stress-induced morphogen
MNQQIQTRWESKRTSESRMVEDVLRQVFPRTDAYRYNSASIRVRVVDERFKGLSTEERDAMVEPLLDRLPRDTQADIVNLLTLYSDESCDSFRISTANDEFEHPDESML